VAIAAGDLHSLAVRACDGIPLTCCLEDTNKADMFGVHEVKV